MWDTFDGGKTMMGRPSDLSADSTGGAYFTQECRLTNQREFTKLEAGGNGDRLLVDTAGNLYVAAGPGVQIYDRQGK